MTHKNSFRVFFFFRKSLKINMFNLPEEVLELILEFLPLNDLLNASLVSKEWMKSIGTSRRFRRNSVINMDSKQFPLLSKKRCYESLNVRQSKPNDPMIKLIKDHEWRTVSFNVLKIKSQKKFVEIIANLKHARQLRINNVAIGDLNSHKKIILEDLTSLTFSDVAIDTFETFMATQPSLKSLSLRFITCDIANPRSAEDYFIDFLQLNSHIKDLELYSDVINNLFKLEIARLVPLKLFSASLNFCDTNNSVVRKNIEDFLTSQGDTLEELKILFQQKFEEIRRPTYRGHWDDYVYVHELGDEQQVSEECKDLQMVLNVWNNMTYLKKLTLRFFINFSENEFNPSMFKKLKDNNNIKVLNIKHNGCTIPSKTVQMMIKLCPNLNALYISTIDKNVVQFCAKNLKLLRSISYSIENDNAINLYTEMIKSDDKINKHIKFNKFHRG